MTAGDGIQEVLIVSSLRVRPCALVVLDAEPGG